MSQGQELSIDPESLVLEGDTREYEGYVETITALRPEFRFRWRTRCSSCRDRQSRIADAVDRPVDVVESVLEGLIDAAAAAKVARLVDCDQEVYGTTNLARPYLRNGLLAVLEGGE